MKRPSVNATKKIAFIGVMVALTIVFSFAPISFGPVTLALMIIPLLITALCQDFGTTFAVGCFLGVINYVAWWTTKAASPVAPVFQNPLVCILSRIMVGVVAWCAYNGARRLMTRIKRSLNSAAVLSIDTAAAIISTALGVATNTGLVSAFTLLFFSGKTLANGTAIGVDFILGWFGLNFVIEIVSFSLLVPPIAAALKRARLADRAFYAVKPADGSAEPTKKEDDEQGGID